MDEIFCFESFARREGQRVQGKAMIGLVHTGVKGGELKVGVGSRVERAGAPVSPRGSAPRPLDLRRWRDMAFFFFFFFFFFFWGG